MAAVPQMVSGPARGNLKGKSVVQVHPVALFIGMKMSTFCKKCAIRINGWWNNQYIEGDYCKRHLTSEIGMKMNREEFKNKYTKKTYLGDGLFAEFDGYHFILSCERENGRHWVGLEPNVFDELIAYKEQLYQDASEIEDEE